MKNLNFQEWCGIKSLYSNSIGLTSNYHKQSSANKSRSFVSRLSISGTLDFHNGCVNSVNFNSCGDLIASGSDDLKICIWDWCKDRKPTFSYDSGHHGNVFQSKFMAHCNDSIIVSCARDGQVRVGYLSSEKGLQQTKKIVQHKGSAHKISVSSNSPHLLRSAGEDGVVYNIDLRDSSTPKKLITVRNDKGGKISLYSIHTNPSREFEFAVSGRDQWARIYDERKILEETKDDCVKRFCPDHLKTREEKDFNHPNITCLMYNYSGSELLCSYNDEEIYLFDATHSTESNFTQVYKGHRNSETVKGVNFFGPKSEYVVSGSDCGHVFIWDKTTEEIVNFVKGDEGVVNVLEPHPTTCILATAGLEHNIKIWVPLGEPFQGFEELSKQIKENELAREEDKKHGTGRDLFYLMMIMRHMRRHRRQRQRARREEREDDDDDEQDDEDSSAGSDMSTDDENDDNMSTDSGGDDDDDDDDVTPACVQS